jgi:hypothetical protein
MPDEMEADWFIDAGFDSIFELQRALYASAVQALNSLQDGGAGTLPSLAAELMASMKISALLQPIVLRPAAGASRMPSQGRSGAQAARAGESRGR